MRVSARRFLSVAFLAAGLLPLVFDVTRRRLAEEKTAAALGEKTLLLQEVYHRVKSNLQIISSLLSMQAAGCGDEAVASAPRDGQDRVYAMSLVHELVYQMEDFSSVDVAEYGSRLVLHSADSYGFPRGWWSCAWRTPARACRRGTARPAGAAGQAGAQALTLRYTHPNAPYLDVGAFAERCAGLVAERFGPKWREYISMIEELR